MNKKSFFGRTLAAFLAIVMIAGCFAGCGGSGSQVQGNNQTDEPAVVVTNPAEELQTEEIKELTAFEGEEISYVMVYNPQIYMDGDPAALQTGSIAEQINVDMDRADGLVAEPEIEPYQQMPLDSTFIDQINLDGGKVQGLGKIYQTGDQADFYCSSESNIEERVFQRFTCVYAGTHANIWVYESLDSAVLEKLGKAFDDYIYEECVSRFGDARFGETVNFLIYPFEGNPNTVGFFCNFDLFSSMECDDVTAGDYGVNRDHNVLNINSLWLEEEDVVISTLAHEFQHLICFTGYFSGGNMCDTWFNEAMSGYIEEALYQGSKESDFACFHDSERIRYGQSLYNFGTDSTGFSFDIGVYGSVYLFSEYLKNIAGGDVFSDFHNKWKNTYTTMNTYEGIYRVMPEETIQKIDELVEYPASFRFSSEEEQWISKLTLSFYLSTFTMDDNTPEQYRHIVLPYLLYDRITDAQIEGGGRVMLAVNDGSFQIPDDADKGLVYVGLNSNLEVVTDFVCR